MSDIIEYYKNTKYETAKKFIQDGKISKGLSFLINDILALYLNEKLSKTEIKEIIENSLKVEIKKQSWFTFWNRKIKKMIEENSNNFDDVIIKNDTKTIIKKEVKNDVKTTPKEVVKKDIKNDSVGSSKRVDVAEIMNSNIGTELFNKYNDFN